MATHTVHGCYIALTGQFEFDDTASGCEGATITGCLVETGEHAGEIEITHDYDGCETQYYACYDPATGKFEFEADDGCCEVACECCLDEDSYGSVGTCPQYIALYIDEDDALYVLELQGTSGEACYWEWEDIWYGGCSGAEKRDSAFWLTFFESDNTARLSSTWQECGGGSWRSPSEGLSLFPLRESYYPDGDLILAGCDGYTAEGTAIQYYPSDSFGNPI